MSGLAMKPRCEKCGAAVDLSAEAWICSHECTFCPACSRALSGRCPNCGGELLRRPRRAGASLPPPYDLNVETRDTFGRLRL